LTAEVVTVSAGKDLFSPSGSKSISSQPDADLAAGKAFAPWRNL